MNSGGDGIFINLDNLNKVRTVALESFTMEKFRHMCILSGCDYLPSIKGLGLYKAHKYLKKSTNVYKVFRVTFLVLVSMQYPFSICLETAPCIQTAYVFSRFCYRSFNFLFNLKTHVLGSVSRLLMSRKGASPY